MIITWRDGVTTLLVAGIATITLAAIKRWDWPLIDNWRLVALMIGVLGLAGCIFSGADYTTLPGAYKVIMSSLGVLSAFLVITGLIFASEFIAVCAASTTALLWVAATVRHILG